MRITLVNFLYPPMQFGGAEKAVNLVAEALVRRGEQVSVICLHMSPIESVEDRNGVRVYRLPLDNMFWPLDSRSKYRASSKLIWHLKDVWNRTAAKRVGRILEHEKPEVVHTHTLNGLSVAVWKEVKSRKIALVHTMHDYYLLCGRSAMFRCGRSCTTPCLRCKLLTAIPKRWSHKIDAIVSVSNFILEEHREHGYFRNVPGEVVYNISDHSTLNRPRHYTLTDRDKLVFGYIGRVCKEKGVETLLHAAAQLNRPDWHIKIAGTGPERYVNALKKTYSNPQVEWLGFTNREDFYGSVDIVVVPSIWRDPLPYVMIESFAAGKGVICTTSGGLSELAKMGKQVATYGAGKSSALAELMNNALANKSDWISGGFRTLESIGVFTESEVTRRYKAVYQRVASLNDF